MLLCIWDGSNGGYYLSLIFMTYGVVVPKRRKRYFRPVFSTYWPLLSVVNRIWTHRWTKDGRKRTLQLLERTFSFQSQKKRSHHLKRLIPVTYLSDVFRNTYRLGFLENMQIFHLLANIHSSEKTMQMNTLYCGVAHWQKKINCQEY